MPTGRPTKYTAELLDKCRTYLKVWHKQGDMIPSHEGLQQFIGISSTCLYDWAKQPEKKEFSDILDEILIKQRLELINKGLSGDFNSNITKLVLGKHGFHDKQDQNVGGQPDNPIVQTNIHVEATAEEAEQIYRDLIG